jgi:hypothetical protein
MRIYAPTISKTRLEQLLSLNAQSKPNPSESALKTLESEKASVDCDQSKEAAALR